MRDGPSVPDSPRALGDLEWLIHSLAESSPQTAEETGELITSAVGVLERHPLIGRLVESGLRELVISLGPTGYVALYRFHSRRRAVWVVRIRHQPAAGYPAA
ncbi:MAG: type II toxin-antitoxin system RelE/ParE family toxin [Myxococcota bacterium]|jgi:plasmid stabilization system protein ParE